MGKNLGMMVSFIRAMVSNFCTLVTESAAPKAAPFQAAPLGGKIGTRTVRSGQGHSNKLEIVKPLPFRQKAGFHRPVYHMGGIRLQLSQQFGAITSKTCLFESCSNLEVKKLLHNSTKTSSHCDIPTLPEQSLAARYLCFK